MASPHTSLLSGILRSYTCFPCEPLHDIMNSIKNLFAELRPLLDDSGKTMFDDVLDATIRKKSAARGCDYLETLITLTGNSLKFTLDFLIAL